MTALLMWRPNRRKANADTELVIQQAAAQAVKTVQEAADETRRELKDAREEIKQLKDDLTQSRRELLQARTEMEQLREQASVERRALLEQLSHERAGHTAAMEAVRRVMSAAQLRQLANSSIEYLLDGGFPDASGL